MSQPPRQRDSTGPSDHELTQTAEASLFSATVGEVIAGRYEITRLLGVGAMGEVFEAVDRQLNVSVALKILRAELSGSDRAVGRFRQELLTARRVSHPNVIRLHDILLADGRWVLSMDLIDGESLRDRLQASGAFDVEAAVSVARQLAQGLAAAHDAGVVHRDLKPANVLIDQEGRVLISDFGIARSLSHAGVTREGLIVGTPDYLSPEQAVGGEVDGRSDLYALGILLCEMLTGELPFNARTTQEAVTQRLARSPTPLAGRQDIPAWLIAICHRLLERDVNRRYQTARDVCADLDAAGGRPPRLQRLIPAAIATAAVMALVAMGYLWLTATPDAVVEERAVAAPGVPSTAVAILPARGTADDDGTAAWLLDVLPTPPSVRLISASRVNTVMRLLSFDAASAGEYRGRIGAELGADVLFIPQFDGASLSIARYDKADEFRVALATGVFSGAQRLVEAARWIAIALDVTDPTLSALPTPDPQALAAFYQGLYRLDQGNSIAAIPNLEQATAELPDWTGGWWALARALEIVGRRDEAQDAALQAGLLATGDDRYSRLAKVWEALATGDYGAADERMARILDRWPDDTLIGAVGAEYFGDAGEFERANALLDRVLEHYPENARAWFLKAKFAILMGEHQLALDSHLLRAQTLHNRLRNRQGQADAINAQGIAYEQLGQLDEALEAYQTAATIRREIGDVRGEAATLRNLAAIEAFRGDADAAEQHLAEARIRLESINDLAGMADLYNDAGVLAEERGDYAAAHTQYRQSLDLRRQLPNDRNVAESLGNVGYVSIELANYTRARTYLQQALQLYDEVGDRAGYVQTQQNLALLELMTGQLDSAGQRLAAARPEAEALQMSQEVAVNQVMSAELALLEGRTADALAAAADAEERFSALDDLRGRTQASLVQARTLLALGALDEADHLLTAVTADANTAQRIEIHLLRLRLATLSPATAQNELALPADRGLTPRAALERDLLEAERTGAPVAERVALLERAAQLGHQELRSQALIFAVRAALAADDDGRARNLLETQWPATAPAGLAAARLAALGHALCPVADRSCNEWFQDHRLQVEELSKQAPAGYRESLMRVFGGG